MISGQVLEIRVGSGYSISPINPGDNRCRFSVACCILRNVIPHVRPPGLLRETQLPGAALFRTTQVARKDFMQRISTKRRNRRFWCQNLRWRPLSEGPYRIFPEGCCRHPIVRSRAKIDAAISNARAFLAGSARVWDVRPVPVGRSSMADPL